MTKLQVPTQINVLTGSVLGFSALTPTRYEREAKFGLNRHSTLWRPANVLAKYGTVGTLDSSAESNYQGTPCFVGFYKVKGYRYFIAAYFNQETGRRIA